MYPWRLIQPIRCLAVLGGEGNEGWGIIICPEYEREKWCEGIDKSSQVKSAMSNKLVEVILAEVALRNIQSGSEAKAWYSKTFQSFCDQKALRSS